jgi:hypothetical protein
VQANTSVARGLWNMIAGAQFGEVSPARLTHRNGYRPRARTQRVL